MAVLVVPGLAAVSVVSERMAERYDALMITPLPPAALILGKYVAVLVYFLLFCAAILPFTGALHFFGTVEVRHIAATAGRTIPLACCCAAVALATAVFARGAMQALSQAYPFVMSMIFLSEIREGFQIVLNIAIPEQAFEGTCLFLIAIAALSTAIYGASRRDEADDAPTANGSLPRTAAERIRVLFPPGPTRFPDGANVFAQRNLAGSVLRNNGLSVFLALITVFFHVCIAAPALSDPRLATLPLVVERSLLMLVPPMVGLQLVRELGHQSIDAYRLTLLRPVDLVMGQYLGTVRRIAPFALSILGVRLVYAVYFTTRDGGWRAAAMSFWQETLLLPVHLAVTVALALAGAAFARTAFTAIPLAYGAVLLVGAPFQVWTVDAGGVGATWLARAVHLGLFGLLPGAALVIAATVVTWLRVRRQWHLRG